MSRAPSAAERASFGADVEVASPASLGELTDVVRAAEAAGRRVAAAGSGAHPEAADSPEGTALLVSAERFDGAVAYEPNDFTIGVGAGTRLEELRELLASHRQELPHDWPARGAGTIGGLVARAPYSPRQGSVGPMHALVLGVEGVRGGGTPFKSGGMVVKNVAGYQIHKLAAGSLGRFGVLTRVNFRVRPIPERRAAGIAAFETSDAAATFARALRAKRLEPACLAILAGNDLSAPRDLPWPAGALRVVWLFEGNRQRVEWLAAEAWKAAAAPVVGATSAGAARADDERAGGSLLDFLASLEEPAADRALGVARVAVASNQVVGAQEVLGQRLAARSGTTFRTLADLLTGQVVVRWTSPSQELAEPVHDVVETAARFEGVARLVHLPAPLRSRFPRDLTPDPNAALSEKVRAAFDPHGTFGGARTAPSAANARAAAAAAGGRR
ncbi:MAG: FAD-binding oxidoreductase [bacterium]